MSDTIIAIQRLKDLSPSQRRAIMTRAALDLEQVRSQTILPMAAAMEKNTYEALRHYSLLYDKSFPEKPVLGKDELKAAFSRYQQQHPAELQAFSLAIDNIRAFHEKQRPVDITTEVGGNRLGFKFQPFDRVALYVPGGKALYPSTVMMGLIPAKLAGVGDITLLSPPSADGKVAEVILAVAYLTGADRVVQAGGAQGVLAMALGVPELNLPAVDFIYGPGNVYVAAAKAYAFSRGWCGIDSFAGPSEVVIIADGSADPHFLAHDLLAQAEHDENASAILLTDNEKVARLTIVEIETAIAQRGDRQSITREAIRRNGHILLVDSLSEAIEFSNEYAPEHLEIQTNYDEDVLAKITAAGSIFVGPYAPVAAGDYFTGTNHILPTGGACRFASGVSVHTFYRRITWQQVSREGLQRGVEPISRMSKVEGLFAEHGYSVLARFEK